MAQLLIILAAAVALSGCIKITTITKDCNVVEVELGSVPIVTQLTCREPPTVTKGIE